MDPFATPAELQDYTGGKILSTDPRVAAALAGASAAIRRYCGWHVWPSLTETVKVDGPGGKVLTLLTQYMTALTSVTESGTLLVDTTDYRWSADGSVKKATSYWTDDYRDIDVVFTHGYDDVADLKQIVLAAVSRALSSPTGATREQAGALSVSWATVAPGVSGGLALLQHELLILETYRIVTV